MMKRTTGRCAHSVIDDAMLAFLPNSKIEWQKFTHSVINDANDDAMRTHFQILCDEHFFLTKTTALFKSPYYT